MNLETTKNKLKALGGFFISGKVLCALSILNGVFGLTGHFRGISMGISVVLMCICVIQLIINKKRIRELEQNIIVSSFEEPISSENKNGNMFEEYIGYGFYTYEDSNDIVFNHKFLYGQSNNLMFPKTKECLNCKEFFSVMPFAPHQFQHMKCYLNGKEINCAYYIEDKKVSYEEFVTHIDSDFLIKQNLLNDIKKLKGLNK